MLTVLCALHQGGLPTFLDVGQSFSASALNEDNLLQQLLAQGKRMVGVCYQHLNWLYALTDGARRMKSLVSAGQPGNAGMLIGTSPVE